MDFVPHQPYTREIPGSRTALLCIHGIVGTPDHFRQFFPVVPEDWSIYSILLDGHGKTVSDFSRSSMRKWDAQTSKIGDELCHRYDNVVILAHSMGTLFAIDLAIAHPDKTRAILLLACPMRVRLRLRSIPTALKVLFQRIPEDDPLAVSTRSSYSIRPDRRLWRYLPWAARYRELFRKIRQTRKKLPQIPLPCYAFQSGKYELVSGKAYEILKKQRNIITFLLRNSNHSYYSSEDFQFLQNIVREILIHSLSPGNPVSGGIL